MTTQSSNSFIINHRATSYSCRHARQFSPTQNPTCASHTYPNSPPRLRSGNSNTARATWPRRPTSANHAEERSATSPCASAPSPGSAPPSSKRTTSMSTRKIGGRRRRSTLSIRSRGRCRWTRQWRRGRIHLRR